MPRDEVPPRSGGSAGAWDDWTSGDVESGDDNDEVEVQEDGVRWKDKHNQVVVVVVVAVVVAVVVVVMDYVLPHGIVVEHW